MNKLIENLEKGFCLICAVIWIKGSGDINEVFKTADIFRRFFR